MFDLHVMIPHTKLLCAVLLLFSVAQLVVRLGLPLKVCVLCMLESHQALLHLLACSNSAVC